MGRWGNMHVHSHYSVIDGMTPVRDLVERADQLGYPMLALTDHKVMSGVPTLYVECMKRGIKPYPGVEAYLLDPFDSVDNTKAKRYHLGLLALNARGYKALVRAVSISFTRPRFSQFPRMTMGDLAELSLHAGPDGIAMLTGCLFGLTQQTLLREGYDSALTVAKSFADIFPHTFVEVQHHDNIHDESVGAKTPLHDDELVSTMMDLADDVGLPMIATQDNHYLLPGEKSAHALMKQMVYGGVDDAFPGDSYHLASEQFVRLHYDRRQWRRVLEGIGHLDDLHDLEIKPLDDYRPRVPRLSDNPDRVLASKCRKGLKRLGIDSLKYRRRLSYELDIIEHLGMANYFLICDRFRRWCREQNYCVEVRGSGNGELALYALGVTQVDPVKYDLMPERFLSKDRIKPPDVDFDIEDIARQPAIDWWRNTFTTMQIGTFASLGASPGNPDRGNAFGTYMAYLRRRCEEECVAVYQAMKDDDDFDVVKILTGLKPDQVRAFDKAGYDFGDPDVRLTKGQAQEAGKKLFYERYGWVKGLHDVRSIDPAQHKALSTIIRMDSVYKSAGVHAAGLLLQGEDMVIQEWIPTMLIPSSESTVTQYTDDIVEIFGFTKIDVLGQTSLRVMRRCQEMIGRPDPTDFTWIPEDDPEACKAMRVGRPDNGIFHYEGYTKAKGGKQLGIRSTADAILGLALYMPGAMDVVPGHDKSMKDLYLERRRNSRARRRVTYLHPVFEKELRDTYGCVIYQDQVMQIMRGLGMSVPAVNRFLTVVKDSGKGASARNVERMAEVRAEFDGLCDAAGIDSQEAWDSTAAFVAYGFNKPHATGYGLRAYRTAYLKAHHPVEYMTAILEANAGNDKEPKYVREARRLQLRILQPSVNAGATWSKDDDGHIHRGLVSIKGIGPAAAYELEKYAPYESIADIIARCAPTAVNGGKDYAETGMLGGTMKVLYDSGALDDLYE